MEFFQNNQTIIIVIVITIIVIVAYSFISKKRRQKQEAEMNSFNSYSSISKPKDTKTETNTQSPYKFSLETGEEIVELNVKHNSTATTKESVEELLGTIEKNLGNTKLTEKQKKLIIEKYRKNLAAKHNENRTPLEKRIKLIENSSMSEAQKSKMIEFLKNKEKK